MGGEKDDMALLETSIVVTGDHFYLAAFDDFTVQLVKSLDRAIFRHVAKNQRLGIFFEGCFRPGDKLRKIVNKTDFYIILTAGDRASPGSARLPA